MKPETVASIAKRTELPSEKLAESLEEMAGKGLIFRSYKDETIVSYVYCQNTIEDGAAWTDLW
jgi:hypothetical protein